MVLMTWNWRKCGEVISTAIRTRREFRKNVVSVTMIQLENAPYTLEGILRVEHITCLSKAEWI